MRPYCFNRTTDWRLLWELRARMRTEEGMCRDLGTEPHSFFPSQLWIGFVFRQRKGFICLAYDDRKTQDYVSCRKGAAAFT